MVTERVQRVGPFAVSGAVAWTFPTGVVLLLGLIACYVGLAAFGYFGTVFPCEEAGRLAVSFVTAGAIAGACLAVAACESVAARITAGLAGASVLGALTWFGVAAISAAHC